MVNVDVVVIGAGIAGLSAARALLSAGVRRVGVIEREPVPCAHSSGRNAAIFRHLSGPAGDLELALRSRALLDELLGSEAAWLRRTGTWFAAESPEEIEPLSILAARAGLGVRRESFAALDAAVPSLAGGTARHGLFCEADGVIDIHAVTQALLRAVTSAGGTVHFSAEVRRVEVEAGRVRGVVLDSGERIAAGALVIAAGAWAGAIGAQAGAPLPLEPRRRHLAQIEASLPLEPDSPVVWCLGDELYYRPESGGALASPCDEHPWKPELPAPDEAGLLLLAEKLARIAPALSDSSVRRSWACLRTFAPDRAAVVGLDPRVAGLWWLAGLGGHGMTGGVAAGEVLAQRFMGLTPLVGDAIAPDRCLTPPGRARAGAAPDTARS